MFFALALESNSHFSKEFWLFKIVQWHSETKVLGVFIATGCQCFSALSRNRVGNYTYCTNQCKHTYLHLYIYLFVCIVNSNSHLHPTYLSFPSLLLSLKKQKQKTKKNLAPGSHYLQILVQPWQICKVSELPNSTSKRRNFY